MHRNLNEILCAGEIQKLATEQLTRAVVRQETSNKELADYIIQQEGVVEDLGKVVEKLFLKPKPDTGTSVTGKSCLSLCSV